MPFCLILSFIPEKELHIGVVAIKKEAFGWPLTTVDNFT